MISNILRIVALILFALGVIGITMNLLYACNVFEGDTSSGGIWTSIGLIVGAGAAIFISGKLDD